MLLSHLSFVFILEPLMQRVAVELQRPLQASFALDLHDGVGVPHHLDQAHAVADGQAAVGQHPGRERTQQRKHQERMEEHQHAADGLGWKWLEVAS